MFVEVIAGLLKADQGCQYSFSTAETLGEVVPEGGYFAAEFLFSGIDIHPRRSHADSTAEKQA